LDKKKRKRLRNWVLVAAGAAIAVFVGSRLLAPKPLSYESVLAESMDITTWFSFAGNIEANSRETILSERSATIDDIYVSEGELVKEG
jgi:HlyD family secretion protein